MIDKLIDKLYSCEAIEALVLGGSRATGMYDEKSDYDFYVYLNGELNEVKRRNLLDEFVEYMEYSNRFWELEDDGRLKNGIEVEFIYRTFEEMDKTMENLLVKGYVSNGYSTCFVDNLLKSKILFDKKNRYQAIIDKYKMLLTPTFYDKIIYKNFPILMDQMPSLFYQVEKAMNRNDQLSMNHRSSAYFEMYFDIIFALNRVTHPGEKRMLEMALNLDLLPKNFQQNIDSYFTNLYVDNQISLKILEEITKELYRLLRSKGYNLTINTFK